MAVIKFFLLFLLVTFSFNAYSADYSQIRNLVIPLLSASLDQKFVYGNGSGVVLAPGYVITAAHVVPEDGKILLWFPKDSPPVQMRVVKIDRELDLALLYGDINCPCAEILTDGLSVDDDVIGVGFPMFTTYGLQIVSPGLVQAIGGNVIATTNTSAPGASGGGIFIKTPTGFKLVGLIDAIAIYTESNIKQIQPWLTFGISNTALIKFLKSTPVTKYIRPTT